MSPLEEYRKKRSFARTPEPKGRSVKTEERFVVHYHQSRRPHYDLRLAAGRVLKSWAVPKGISLDPSERHLAVQVEDHPYSYKDFEGTIPAGNYGAGTVMIWDEGYYRPILRDDFDKDIESGHLTFLLMGQKLKGEYALIRMKKAEPKNWLLIKAADNYAGMRIRNADRSAKTGRDIEEIKKGSLLEPPKPMLATLTGEAFNDEAWEFEIKWDGYRAIAVVQDGEARLYSRNLKSLNDRFLSIATSLSGKIDGTLILDGEIVALDKDGRSTFQHIDDEAYEKAYYVFDILRRGGRDLTGKRWDERRQILQREIKSFPHNVIFSESIRGQGIDFFQVAKRENLEGIIGKKRDSRYFPGKRSREWLKIKIVKTQEGIIVGYTPGAERRAFGSLILAVNEGKSLRYIGKVGTGFNAQTMNELLEKMDTIKAPEPSVAGVKDKEGIVWLKPILVAQIKFQEWTREGHLRQPVYLGLREDKNPSEVRAEVV